jgi:hypothetical protein
MSDFDNEDECLRVATAAIEVCLNGASTNVDRAAAERWLAELKRQKACWAVSDRLIQWPLDAPNASVLITNVRAVLPKRIRIHDTSQSIVDALPHVHTHARTHTHTHIPRYHCHYPLTKPPHTETHMHAHTKRHTHTHTQKHLHTQTNNTHARTTFAGRDADVLQDQV